MVKASKTSKTTTASSKTSPSAGSDGLALTPAVHNLEHLDLTPTQQSMPVQMKAASTNPRQMKPYQPSFDRNTQSIIQRKITADGVDAYQQADAELTAIHDAALMTTPSVNGADDILTQGVKSSDLTGVLPDSQNTFGLAKEGNNVYAIGSKAFANAAKAQWLGARPSGLHGESALIKKMQNKPESIWTTQNSCFFCYGYLAKEGVNHQSLRDDPFPQRWKHPTMDFEILNKAEYLAVRLPHWHIDLGKMGQAYYVPV